MPRPFGAPNDNCVDLAALARTGGSVERVYSAAELARLSEAGSAAGSTVAATFTCGVFDQRTTIHGELSGALVLTCQRCLKPVTVSLQERFDLVVVQDEAEAAAEIGGGYEPMVVDATKVDLKWLAEEQVLLALPLVAMHEPGECERSAAVVSEPSESGQKPFGNLRELLRKG